MCTDGPTLGERSFNPPTFRFHGAMVRSPIPVMKPNRRFACPSLLPGLGHTIPVVGIAGRKAGGPILSGLQRSPPLPSPPTARAVSRQQQLGRRPGRLRVIRPRGYDAREQELRLEDVMLTKSGLR